MLFLLVFVVNYGRSIGYNDTDNHSVSDGGSDGNFGTTDGGKDTFSTGTEFINVMHTHS